jgi:CRISPR-associated protein Cmr1
MLSTARGTSIMQKLELTVRFNTPAFLGNAEQNGQWRTPPFKALLRQWWRVFRAADLRYDNEVLREKEGELFGNTWLSPVDGHSRFCKSRVTLSLDTSEVGTLNSQAWPGGPMEEVVTTRDGKSRVRADLYLGYGPVLPPSRRENRSNITIRTAIDWKNHSIRLRLRVPNENADEIRNVVKLMNWFGTVGSRSRNGWGSLTFESQALGLDPSVLPKSDDPSLKRIHRQWDLCLDSDWAHAIGSRNNKPLIWKTQPFSDWRKAMGCLANVRILARRVAKEFRGPGSFGGIHLLGYPAGGQWELRTLGREARLATQLRFKVARAGSDYVGIVTHMPHRFPENLRVNLDGSQKRWLQQNEISVWEAIHNRLDDSNRLQPL